MLNWICLFYFAIYRKPPVPKEPWCDVFDATQPGAVCPQTELYHSRAEMNEDCLNLNIYTPVDAFNKSLPVLFVVHAGDYDLQSGKAEPMYGPQLLLQKDIVVVTMNYRLGALGFLALCTEDISGNAGVKDVLLALKVIKENIDRFGGNPNKIMAKGAGGGAGIIQMIMLSTECSNLFQIALITSGTLLSSKYIQSFPRENAMELARELGLDVSNNDCLVEQLKSVDAFDIVEAQEAMSRRDLQRGFRYYKPFKPTVELPYENAIVTKAPLKSMQEGAICDIPIVIGFNSQEALEIFPMLKEEPELIENFNKNPELLVPECIKYPYGSEARRNLANEIKTYYFNDECISFVDVQRYVNLVSDCLYIYPVDFFVKLYKQHKNSPVYYYEFDGDDQLNWYKIINNITYPGTAHLDEIGYTFMTSATKSRYQNLDSTSEQTKNNILQLFSALLNDGAPPASANWPEAGDDNYHYAVYDHAVFPVYSRPLRERMEFWDLAVDEYYSSEYGAKNYFC